MKPEPKPERCKCLEQLEMQEGITAFANDTVTEVIEAFGESCPKLMSYVVDQLVARLIHIEILSYDHNTVNSKLPDMVAKRIDGMSGRLPALLMAIIKEAETRSDTNASN